MKRALEYVVKPVFKGLDDTASQYPDRVGFIVPGKGEYTFSEVKRLSDLLAFRLLQEGLEKGDRVVVLLPNSIEYVISFYGIQKAGGVVVPFSTLYTDAEVKEYLPIVEPAGIIASSPLYDQLDSLKRHDGFKYVFEPGSDSFFQILRDVGATALSLPVVNVFEDLAVIPFSSGTTGTPKGVELTHSNLFCNIQQIIDGYELFSSDVFINHLPFFHIYGMNVLCGTAVYLGARQIILDRFEADFVLNQIEQYAGTVLFTVPTALNHLVKHCDLSARNLKSLRFVNIGGGALNPEMGAAFTAKTGVTVIQGYGLTESSPTTHTNPLDKIKHDSIGRPLADTFVRIVDPESFEDLPSGTRGELWIKGPQVMKGYFRNREATRQSLVDGWLRTGDIAWQDEDGYTFIVDRLKELIKYKSYQVSPAELENLLMEMEEIEDCAVIGKPDEDAGELPVAFVAAKKDLKGEAVMDFVASKVAPYKKLREVTFVDSIPRSASGKILRKALKEKFFASTS